MFAAVIVLMIIGILAIQGALSGLNDWIENADRLLAERVEKAKEIRKKKSMEE